MSNYTERLSKCYTGVVHDIMRDMKYENFTLPPEIKPSKKNYVLAGQIFTIEGEVDKNQSHHESLLAWTGFLSKAPNDKVIICQPNTNEVALMGGTISRDSSIARDKGLYCRWRFKRYGLHFKN